MLKRLLLLFIPLSLISCDDSPTPGEGPTFSSSVTAEQLFNMVSVNFFIPDELQGDERYVSGTRTCPGGGEIIVKDARSDGDKKESSEITYHDCQVTESVNNTTLTYNGKVNYFLSISGKSADEPTDAILVYRHSLSFSGDIGFASDCEFHVNLLFEPVTFVETTQTISGECTYTDSAGNTLSINGDEMKAALD